MKNTYLLIGDVCTSVNGGRMLISEDQMNEESQFLLLHNPTRGVSYQMIGALNRLGRKALALYTDSSDKDSIKEIPLISYLNPSGAKFGSNPDLQIKIQKDVRYALLSLDQKLGVNTPATEQEIQRLMNLYSELIAENLGMGVLFCLPSRTENFLVQKLLQHVRSNGCIVLSPAVWGPKDGGLFDQSWELLQSAPSLLFKENKADLQKITVTYLGDLTALFISIMQKPELCMGKILEMDAQEMTFSEWKFFIQSVVETDKPSGLKKVFAFFDSTEEYWKLPQVSQVHSDALKPRDIFPLPKVKLKRSLDQCLWALKKHPSLQLIYPPSRSP